MQKTEQKFHQELQRLKRSVKEMLNQIEKMERRIHEDLSPEEVMCPTFEDKNFPFLDMG